MRGRTMFVVPFLMGPPGSRFAKVGVEITDSRYVVLNMRIMTRMGRVALDHLRAGDEFTRCLHSLGDLSPDRRFIVHFPEENAVWSIGSGYGGNALLGKKCLALRLASWLAREEGWLAEHMLILGLRRPDGAAALHHRRVSVGLRQDQPRDARAAGVDAGLGGMDRRRRHRVAAARRRRAAVGGEPRGRLLRGRPRHQPPHQRHRVRDDSPRHDLHQRRAATRRHAVVGRARRSAAGRSARLAGPAVDAGVGREGGASQQPLHDAGRELPHRCRRSSTTPTACRSRRCSSARAGSVACRSSIEARSWAHGTFLGATLSSETTAAATGKVGVLRRDPMAMLPFCGYNMADYFAHWLDVGAALASPPAIFRVNWFRTGEDGRFLWPGFGDNLRVLAWILDALRGARQRRRDADRLRAAAERHRPHRPRALRRGHGARCSRSIPRSGSKPSPARTRSSIPSATAFPQRSGGSTTSSPNASTTRPSLPTSTAGITANVSNPPHARAPGSCRCSRRCPRCTPRQ